MGSRFTCLRLPPVFSSSSSNHESFHNGIAGIVHFIQIGAII